MPVFACITGAAAESLPEHPSTFLTYDRRQRTWVCYVSQAADVGNPIEAHDAPFGDVGQMMKRLGNSGLLEGNTRVVYCQTRSVNELIEHLSMQS
ncbi:MAG: hypothetical protein WBC44_01360 [Planctomycetaceae bacterium]